MSWFDEPFIFKSATAKFDPDNAYSLGKAAFLAYRTEAEVRATATAWGFRNLRFIDRDETQAYVAGNDQMVMLAFRGTEPKKLRDWLTDAQAEFTAGPMGQVHRGFLGALNDAWREVRGAITEFQDKGQSLWVTGHSLGAALATLAVATMRAEPDKPVYGLYTFGQPRTGDRDFEQRFNADFKSRCFRFVNNNDVVTRVPLRTMGYSHVGTFLYFDAGGNLHDDMGFWFRFVDSVKGAVEDLGNLEPDNIRDHSMDTGYLPRLAKRINPF